MNFDSNIENIDIKGFDDFYDPKDEETIDKLNINDMSKEREKNSRIIINIDDKVFDNKYANKNFADAISYILETHVSIEDFLSGDDGKPWRLSSGNVLQTSEEYKTVPQNYKVESKKYNDDYYIWTHSNNENKVKLLNKIFVHYDIDGDAKVVKDSMETPIEKLENVKDYKKTWEDELPWCLDNANAILEILQEKYDNKLSSHCVQEYVSIDYNNKIIYYVNRRINPKSTFSIPRLKDKINAQKLKELVESYNQKLLYSEANQSGQIIVDLEFINNNKDLFLQIDDIIYGGDTVIKKPSEFGVKSKLTSLKPVNNPFGGGNDDNTNSGLCVDGQTGSGKNTTILPLLRNEKHKLRVCSASDFEGERSIIFSYSPRESEFRLSDIGEFIQNAYKNPETKYTVVFDESHEYLPLINSEFLQALSKRRNESKRQLSIKKNLRKLLVEDEDTKEQVIDTKFVEYNKIYVPDNLGFILLTSRGYLIEDHPDLKERLNFITINKDELTPEEKSKIDFSYILKKLENKNRNI